MSAVGAAVIITTYNGRALLERFLPSMIDAVAHAGAALYVVDNASSDGTAEWVAQRPSVRLVRSERNCFFGGGNNLGVQAALRDHPALEWVVIANNDIAVPKHFVSGMTDTLDSEVGIVGVKTLFLQRFVQVKIAFDRASKAFGCSLLLELPDLDEERLARCRLGGARRVPAGIVIEADTTLWIPVVDAAPVPLVLRHRKTSAARAEITLSTRRSDHRARLGFGESATFLLPAGEDDACDLVNNAGTAVDLKAGTTRDIGFDEIDLRQYDRPREVDAVCGVAMAVRAPLYRALGGFDESYEMYFEDVDLCLRAAERGARCWYNPAVTIRHLHSATSVERSAAWHRHVRRSAMLFRARHQEPTAFAAFYAEEIERARHDELARHALDAAVAAGLGRRRAPMPDSHAHDDERAS